MGQSKPTIDLSVLQKGNATYEPEEDCYCYITGYNFSTPDVQPKQYGYYSMDYFRYLADTLVNGVHMVTQVIEKLLRQLEF